MSGRWRRRSLGADNLPYVLLVAGFGIGFVMAGYTRIISPLRHRLIIPVTQAGLAVLFVVLWFLFSTGLTADGLLPIEKALAFERLSLCSGFSTEELLHVAAIAQETPVEAGVGLFTRSDALAFYVLLEGKVRLVADGQPEIVADEGDVIGLYETLACVPVGRDGHGLEKGTALRVTRDDLYDLLAHRPELLKQMLTAMFRAR